MILSMTGYGKHQADVQDKSISVELRSLNSRYLDLSIRIPQSLKSIELELRQKLNKALLRGKVEITIQIGDENTSQIETPINKVVFKQYYTDLKALTDEFNISDDDLLSNILKLPNVLDVTESTLDDSFYPEVYKTIDEAIAHFNKFREKEGKELADDLEKRVTLIAASLKEIELLQPSRVAQIRTRIEDHTKEYLSDIQIDENRLEQEMIFYIEKLDITEEVVRLTSHCSYFIEVMKSAENNGKKLNFIGQEMGREINTIGAKASHVEMQKHVVQMKDELEKIKEQLNNVL